MRCLRSNPIPWVRGRLMVWHGANEKRHLRLRPDDLRDPRSPRRRRQVDVVLGPALVTSPAQHERRP
jgi:hypothetical protein